MKNEELIERNIETLGKILEDDFLEEEYFGIEYQKHKDEIINLIKSQKAYLEKYKSDYESYFILEGITTGVAGTWIVWGLIGLIILLTYIISSLQSAQPIFFKNIITIIALGFVTPSALCWKIIPNIKGKSTYKDYLENLNAKLEIINNDQLEKGMILEQKVTENKKINDSFVRMLKETIIKIKSLNYPDKEQDLLKIKEISEKYFALLRKEIALDEVINLTTNEDTIALQRELIDIENDAIAKAKIASDESALESEFAPLTTLDRSSVELDTGFRESYNEDTPAILKRKLNFYDE